MTKALISGAWDEAKAVFAHDGKLLVSLALALVVLPEVVASVIDPRGQGTAAGAFITLVTALIGIVAQLALIRLALGPSTAVGTAIGHGARRFPAALGALVLLMLLFILLCLPFAVVAVVMGVEVPTAGKTPGPGFSYLMLILLVIMVAVGVRFMMTSSVATAETAGPVGIMKRSWELTRGHYWPLLGLAMALFMVLIVLSLTATALGGIAARLVSPELEPFSAGSLILGLATGLAQGVFSLLSCLMLARVYARLSGRNATASVPSSAD